MGTSKAKTLACCSLAAESKLAGKIEIGQETQEVTNGIGDSLLHKVVANPIDEIMKEKSEHSDNSKP